MRRVSEPVVEPPRRLPRSRPRVADHGRAQWRLADLAAVLDSGLAARLQRDANLRAVLGGIADHSPEFWDLVEADPAAAIGVFDGDVDEKLDSILAELLGSRNEVEADLMKRLRRARKAVTRLVAIAELGGLMTPDDAMQALSRSVDALVEASTGFLLRRAQAAGHLRPDANWSQAGVGVVVFGLGKLGGREMDYAFAAELVILYDASHPAAVDPAAVVFVRMARDLERLLQTETADGVALRVDLRLRPQPGARAVATEVGAALLYYEAFGQNWERAALVKARVVAGDRAVGASFTEALSPFLWRRYFDFAAIADTLAIKRQIPTSPADDAARARGHDVRLGRGGLRDIELFVVTQQLIFGGKRPKLRGSRTVPMLRRLRKEGWIGDEAADHLAAAYAFLSRTHHRLQIVAGGDTDALPQASDAFDRFARFCGFASAARFAAVYETHLRAVIYHSSLLFETEPDLGADGGGDLVFTGVDDDPATLRTLSKLGFKTPGIVAATVRAWHSGLRPAVGSNRAREQLTHLVPKLLATFAQTSEPDAAVAAFDRALGRLSAASELFSILAANPALRTLFADILGSAPVLSEAVATHPHLLDNAINWAAQTCCDEDAIEARVEAALAHAIDVEDFLDAVRDYRREEHFLIGVRLLSGDLDADAAGQAYAALAVGIIRVVLRRVRAAFVAEHGDIAGSELAVLAMGRLGSREMTASSDLDLVVIYEFGQTAPVSNGSKPLEALTYFTRLTQRLVSHLTVATRRGRLFDVDMRLRPSGRQGPLATKFSAFAAYQRTTAQTWEHMALTRARPIAGDMSLGRRVGATITSIFREAGRSDLAAEITDLRAAIAHETPVSTPWDLKRVPGGLLDLDFIAQYVFLRRAAERRDNPEQATRAILSSGADGSWDSATGERLAAAHRLMSTTLHLMCVALPEGMTPDVAGRPFTRRLVKATGTGSFGKLKARLSAGEAEVRGIIDMLLGTPG